MVDMMVRGGPVMVPIVLCSILALAIVLERLWFLQRVTIDARQFLDEVTASIRRNKIVDALDLCGRTPGPVASIVKAALAKHDRTRAEIKEVIEDAAVHQIPALEKHLRMLATLGHISPLLGLLGTVTGMVSCFQTVQERSSAFSAVSPSDLAGGIWEALITTVAGLAVAIPTYVAYNYLASRVNDAIREMERGGTEMVNLLTDRSEEPHELAGRSHGRERE